MAKEEPERQYRRCGVCLACAYPGQTLASHMVLKAVPEVVPEYRTKSKT